MKKQDMPTYKRFSKFRRYLKKKYILELRDCVVANWYENHQEPMPSLTDEEVFRKYYHEEDIIGMPWNSDDENWYQFIFDWYMDSEDFKFLGKCCDKYTVTYANTGLSIEVLYREEAVPYYYEPSSPMFDDDDDSLNKLFELMDIAEENKNLGKGQKRKSSDKNKVIK